MVSQRTSSPKISLRDRRIANSSLFATIRRQAHPIQAPRQKDVYVSNSHVAKYLRSLALDVQIKDGIIPKVQPTSTSTLIFGAALATHTASRNAQFFGCPGAARELYEVARAIAAAAMGMPHILDEYVGGMSG